MSSVNVLMLNVLANLMLSPLFQEDPSEKIMQAVQTWLVSRFPLFSGIAVIVIFALIVWSSMNPQSSARHSGKLVTVFGCLVGLPWGLSMIAYVWHLAGGTAIK